MKRHSIGDIILALSRLNVPRRCRAVLLKHIWLHRYRQQDNRYVARVVGRREPAGV